MVDVGCVVHTRQVLHLRRRRRRLRPPSPHLHPRPQQYSSRMNVGGES